MHFSRFTSLILIFTMLAALLSCSSDTADETETTTLSSYLPPELSTKTIEAWYTKSENGDYPSEGVHNYSGTYTFYFFSDQTWIMTISAEWTQNDQLIAPKFALYEGTFSKEGSYTNGTIFCTTTSISQGFGCMPIPPAPSSLTVSAGQFSLLSYTFQKQ